MYKVFFKESSFSLTDQRSFPENNRFTHVYENPAGLERFVRVLLEGKEVFHAVIGGRDEEEILDGFKAIFRYFEAAGGCVFDGRRLLVIRRMGLFDLPKGHMEAGECPEECAVREVEEECGIGALTILAPLPSTFHLYPHPNNKRICLKKTYWFAMTCAPSQRPTPQWEEGIVEASWREVSEVKGRVMENTHESLQELFRLAADMADQRS